MFCDLVGSTMLSAQLDPEEYREVVRAYQETCAAVIRRYEGYMAQYLGDGVLVYFGYPVAHEDEAARAVRTGLEIVEKIHTLTAPSPVSTGEGRGEGRLQVRIGIHTGLVVVGEIGSSEKREILALGETPNIAARIQGLAEPDAVVISAATAQLIEGYFIFQEFGPHRLKGIAQPMPVYRVLHESGLRTRLQVARAKGFTPLVGRKQEVALLLHGWEQAREGAGQAVLVGGEAGIGKSRVLQTLAERVAGEPHARLDLRCSPYHQNSALYPIIDVLQRALQFHQEDSLQVKLAKLESILVRYQIVHAETAALLATLLALPPRSLLPPLSPQQLRQKTIEASLSVLRAVAEQQPLLLLVEDLHWVDPSTLELLGLLLPQLSTARILAVFTFRPEFLPPWPPRSYLTVLTLTRLPGGQVEEIVEWVAGEKTLSAKVREQIVKNTDGVPLFVEELTKMVVESSAHTEAALISSLSPLAIPATLYDSLMARLDRLSRVKEVAQLAATIGREFSYELLRAVSPLKEAALRKDLARLIEAELIYPGGLLAHPTYIFKHALIREAACQSLLKSTRQQYHQRIAQALVRQFPETGETQPELLAYYYTEAGLAEPAVQYWQQAGQQALTRSANEEAISHLTQALEVLKLQPDTLERKQYELALHVMRGTPLLMSRGYAAAEVQHAYARARELCQQIGESPQLLPALAGLVRYYIVRAELQTAYEVGQQLLRLAEESSGPFLVGAHALLGIVLLRRGEFTPAREHLAQGITLYDLPQHRFLASLYGDDPGVASLVYMAVRVQLKVKEASSGGRILTYSYKLQRANFEKSAFLHTYNCTVRHLTGTFGARPLDETGRA